MLPWISSLKICLHWRAGFSYASFPICHLRTVSTKRLERQPASDQERHPNANPGRAATGIGTAGVAAAFPALPTPEATPALLLGRRIRTRVGMATHFFASKRSSSAIRYVVIYLFDGSLITWRYSVSVKSVTKNYWKSKRTIK